MKNFDLSRLSLAINNNVKKLRNRNSVILPLHVGKVIFLYNGKNFEKIVIKKQMIGYKIGEFVQTRKKFTFKKN